MNDFNQDFNNDSSAPEQNNVDIKTAKKTYSTIGLALCSIILTVYAVQFLIGIVIGIMGNAENNWLLTSSWGTWILTFAPMYLVGIPVCLLIMKKTPKNPPKKSNWNAKQVLIALCITFFLMNIGNYLGSFLSSFLSQGTAENALNDFAMDTNPLKILVMVILAPLLEEVVFRKQLLDRTYAYGEKTAVLFSGLLFGLFHMNLFQFFYAFFIGCLLAYIYVHTGKLRYPVIIHSIVNFFGSVIAPFVISKLDLEALEKVSTLDPMTTPTEELMELIVPLVPGLIIFFAYYAVWSALSLAGFILIILKRKSVYWNKTELQLPEDSVATTVYMNLGIVLFIVVTVSFTLISLFL